MLIPVLLPAAQRQRAHKNNSLLYSTSDSNDNSGNQEGYGPEWTRFLRCIKAMLDDAHDITTNNAKFEHMLFALGVLVV